MSDWQPVVKWIEKGPRRWTIRAPTLGSTHEYEKEMTLKTCWAKCNIHLRLFVCLFVLWFYFTLQKRRDNAILQLRQISRHSPKLNNTPRKTSRPNCSQLLFKSNYWRQLWFRTSDFLVGGHPSTTFHLLYISAA